MWPSGTQVKRGSGDITTFYRLSLTAWNYLAWLVTATYPGSKWMPHTFVLRGRFSHLRNGCFEQNLVLLFKGHVRSAHEVVVIFCYRKPVVRALKLTLLWGQHFCTGWWQSVRYSRKKKKTWFFFNNNIYSRINLMRRAQDE